MVNKQKFETILETHYYSINGAAIKYSTRNICADSTAKILEEISRILFPNEKIEIYVLPAQYGCHRDSFWIKLTNNSTIATICGVILTALFAYPLTSSQIRVNQSQEELNNLQIEQLKNEIKEKNPQASVTTEQLQDIVRNPSIKQNRNRHFQQLQHDGEIEKEKFVAKSMGQVMSEKTIESIDFGKYVENLQQIITVKTIEKIHHLTVIKSVNDEEYKDLMWIVEDVNGKEKFGVHMADEEFYDFHLKNVLGLKSLLVSVRYTINENQIGEQSIKDKEIISVYRYNNIERMALPVGAKIEPAPLELWTGMREEFQMVKGKDARKEDISENQLAMFKLD